MAIEHWEAFDSRDGTDAVAKGESRADLRWFVRGSDVLADIKAYMAGVVPSTYDGLTYKTLNFRRRGWQIHEVTATYCDPSKKQEEPLDTGDWRFEFDTTGGTQKITQSFATTRISVDARPAPDHQGSIGVKADDVEGCDIVVPKLEFSITKRQPRADITLAYVRNLTLITGTTNVANIWGFNAGELLFLGATGREGSATDPEITYKFAASPNVSLTIAGKTFNKPGWSYLWIAYEGSTNANAYVKKPRAIYLETVYRSGDFATLAI